MEDYKKRLAVALAETGAIFFDKGLFLKDMHLSTLTWIPTQLFRSERDKHP